MLAMWYSCLASPVANNHSIGQSIGINTVAFGGIEKIRTFSHAYVSTMLISEID
jgi:hypothetical protein